MIHRLRVFHSLFGCRMRQPVAGLRVVSWPGDMKTPVLQQRQKKLIFTDHLSRGSTKHGHKQESKCSVQVWHLNKKKLNSILISVVIINEFYMTSLLILSVCSNIEGRPRLWNLLLSLVKLRDKNKATMHFLHPTCPMLHICWQKHYLTLDLLFMFSARSTCLKLRLAQGNHNDNAVQLIKFITERNGTATGFLKKWNLFADWTQGIFQSERSCNWKLQFVSWRHRKASDKDQGVWGIEKPRAVAS